MDETFSHELERLADEQLHDDNTHQRQHRCGRVCDIAAAGGITEPADYYHAAIVLLHGETIEEFATALYFARTATQRHDHRAWAVIAASWDRLLIAKHQPQRFGTQFIRINGRWSLGEIDPSVNDAERAFYGVPPLWVQIKSAAAMQRRETNQ